MSAFLASASGPLVVLAERDRKDDRQRFEQNKEALAAGLVQPLSAFTDDGGIGHFERPDRGHHSSHIGQAIADAVGIGRGFVIEAP
jgi:hypothetical protein